MKTNFKDLLDKTANAIEDPELKSRFTNYVENPCSDTLKEVMELDMMQAGAGETASVYGISAWLGNKGNYCTLTKECQANCN